MGSIVAAGEGAGELSTNSSAITSLGIIIGASVSATKAGWKRFRTIANKDHHATTLLLALDELNIWVTP